MAKKKTQDASTQAAAGDSAPARGDSVLLRYVGPSGTESHRYGALEPGRDYPESDAEFASYLVTTHPDHWAYAE